jgi:hypothetical protein
MPADVRTSKPRWEADFLYVHPLGGAHKKSGRKEMTPILPLNKGKLTELTR